MAMGSLTSSIQRQTGLLFSLPDELIEVIAFLLPFKDRLAFADTCTYCRGFVSDLDCSTRCTNAGLSLPNESSPRAMAKLLVQPRAGVCNWSDADGKPQAMFERKKVNYDFSKVWSVQEAIRKSLSIDVHPTITTQKYLILGRTRHFKNLTIYVSPNQEIRLFDHRLYMHEFLTHPPLKELRVIFQEDEGPLNDHNDITLVFVISNPTGVTLANYWTGLYKFLWSTPSPQMPLADYLKDARNKNVNFQRDCSTNLAMLDIYFEEFHEDIPFSHKALKWELPLNVGELEAKIHPMDPESLVELERPGVQTFRYGQPLEGFGYGHWSMRPTDDLNGKFWARYAPVLQF